MTTTNDRVKRVRSCFICGVEMHDDIVVLEDSGRNQFIIDKKDKMAIGSFVFWFKNVYLRGVPQVLSSIDYSIVQKNEAESYCLVNKIVANPNGQPPIDDNNKEG